MLNGRIDVEIRALVACSVEELKCRRAGDERVRPGLQRAERSRVGEELGQMFVYVESPVDVGEDGVVDLFATASEAKEICWRQVLEQEFCDICYANKGLYISKGVSREGSVEVCRVERHGEQQERRVFVFASHDVHDLPCDEIYTCLVGMSGTQRIHGHSPLRWMLVKYDLAHYSVREMSKKEPD